MERAQLLKDSKGNAQSLKALIEKGLLQEKTEPGQEEAEKEARKSEAVFKTSSLLDGMKAEDVTLEDALKLLSLPRLLGTDPGNDDNEVFAHHGRVWGVFFGGHFAALSKNNVMRRTTNKMKNSREKMQKCEKREV